MKKGITLVLSVVGIILFLVFQLQAQKNVVMAVPVVKEAVYERLRKAGRRYRILPGRSSRLVL